MAEADAPRLRQRGQQRAHDGRPRGPLPGRERKIDHELAAAWIRANTIYLVRSLHLTIEGVLGETSTGRKESEEGDQNELLTFSSEAAEEL